jgi:hypothetical protein
MASLCQHEGQISVPGFLGLWHTDIHARARCLAGGQVNVAAAAATQLCCTTGAAYGHINFGDQIQLLGYDVDTTAAQPGGCV